MRSKLAMDDDPEREQPMPHPSGPPPRRMRRTGQYVVVVLLKLGPTTTRISAFLKKGCRVEHQKAVLRPISASLRYLRFQFASRTGDAVT